MSIKTTFQDQAVRMPEPPSLSSGMKKCLELLYADLDDYTNLIQQTIRTSVPGYMGIDDVQLDDDLKGMTCTNLRLWFRCLLEETPPSQDDLASVAAAARRRFHQGFPLLDFLQAFRTGANTIWRELLRATSQHHDIQVETLLRISPFMLEYNDMLGQTLSQAFLKEQEQSARHYGEYQAQLCDVIFNEPENRERFLDLAGQLRIDPLLDRIALSVVFDRTQDMDEFGTPRNDIPGKCAEFLDTDYPVLSTNRKQRLTFWLAPADRERGMDQPCELAARCRRMVEALPIKALGIGLIGHGASGWRDSALQAWNALEWLCANDQRGQTKVQHYSGIVLEDSILKGVLGLSYFKTLLDGLNEDPILEETLQVWLTTPKLTRKSAASRLNIHPNTLDYRLRRIEARLGADLGDISWLARLHVALGLKHRG